MATETPKGGGGILTIGIMLMALAGAFKLGESKKEAPQPRIVYYDAEEDIGAPASTGGGNEANPDGTPATNPDGTPTYDPNMQGGTPGDGTGASREWRGYVETDVEALRAQLPPQAKHLAESFIAAGQTYNMDPLFLASISAHETGSWTSNAFYNRNNAMGVSNASGVINQASHDTSIQNMAASLAGASGTAGYYNGANTVGQVGAIYAPIGAGNDPNGQNNYWASGVGTFYDGFSSNLGR